MPMRMNFGIFMAPFHAPGHNPTISLEDDLELLQHLDTLGYDEAWIGEHHSAGSEIIASPEIFIMAAAERTQRIKLGTGVVSMPYHNPLWTVERMVLLDHLTRGRVMFGMGPGALPTDASMLGLEPQQMRPIFEEYIDIAYKLLTTDEPINYQSDRLTLKDARVHLRPYSDPLFDLAVAAVASPSGAKLAGRYGAGLLSLGATVAVGMDVLAHHWTIQEQAAAEYGQVADRAKWRLVGLMHLAETEEQAREDVKYGMTQWFRYFQNVAAFPQMAVEGGNLDEMIDFVNGGLGVIGTPEMMVKQINELVEQSNGGFGAYLTLAHNWANKAATSKSFELFAREVMPHFQSSGGGLQAAADRAQARRDGLAEKQLKAVAEATERYEKETGTAG
ncbi:LLM class flavin-dependent oxidoreductase [Ruegeria sp. HKCCD4315]|nr:LLM class flavin-dependent oxidoreductase [Ruegeria sp. HKCCD4332]NOD89767.1 LLM class flavin-dependent oxidoreductase [Ruegeria sp. HKCCD4318]NOE14787.1 LLM class flavin-dependent oxidoreductase [Ruegeria sp. HKCCD4318-2]NOG11611.1 LLM class flavin-dependent oxidoreductase [Ruegeria sp. HKCCD4315]